MKLKFPEFCCCDVGISNQYSENRIKQIFDSKCERATVWHKPSNYWKCGKCKFYKNPTPIHNGFFKL